MFVPTHEIVAPEGSAPRRTVLFLHGILGSRRNWRGFAQSFVESRPEWRAVLVDLRHHGDSVPAPGPSTVAQCAADLEPIWDELGGIDWVAGHSFGGKVALELAERRAPERVLLLDAPPAGRLGSGAERSSPRAILAELRGIPLPLASRRALVERMEAVGWSESVARWMTTNLEPVDGGYAWKFDLDGIEALMNDYARTDLWHLLESPPRGTHIDVVRGTQSEAWSDAELERLDAVAESGRVEVHTLDAGHWLQVDDPDGLLAIFEQLDD